MSVSAAEAPSPVSLPADVSRPLVSFDMETYLIGPGAVLPKPVCCTIIATGEAEARLVANGDGEAWRHAIREMVEGAADGAFDVVGANIAGFDWPILHEHFPELRPALWRALERGAVRDVQAREKLLNLCTIGEVDVYYTPDGKGHDLRYSLAHLAARYLGRDRFAEKEDEDSWRKHFAFLDGEPSSRYPVEAAAYAKHDAVDALRVFEAQEARKRDMQSRGARGHDGGPFDPFCTEFLHVGAKHGLVLMTLVGFRVDPDEAARLEAAVDRELALERLSRLVASGILMPAMPARPYKNGARNADGSPRMTASEPAHVSKKLLQALVERTIERENAERMKDGESLLRLKMTDPSEKFPEGQISTDAEVIGDLAVFDPVIGEYDHYQGLQKLVSVEIPRLKAALAVDGILHPTFEELKRTGRTSSRKSDLFPSTNIQQVPRGFDVEVPCPDRAVDCIVCKGKGVIRSKIEPRHAYVSPIEGWVLYSVDYSALELVTAAQKVFSVTGHSRLRDVINAGADPHAWLGAQMAFVLNGDFNGFCRAALGPRSDDRDEVYRLFKALSGGSDDEKKFYKLYRNFAKPTGLGFPGGLGPRTLLSYAKKTYGVIIESVEQAKMFRTIWFDAFPEFREFFRWVERDCRDDTASEDSEHCHGYFTPLGMYRARCTYPACCNGSALQSPSGEGAKIAVFNVVRASWDPSMGSCLLNTRPLAFVHDELIGAIPRDQWMHERCKEVERIMVAAMKIICPDMVVKAESCLQTRWDKNAEPRVDSAGRLLVWSPDGA